MRSEQIRTQARSTYTHSNVRDRYDADLLIAGFTAGAEWADAHVEPQGEPSDAQVLAALNAYDPRFPGEDLDDFQENEIADMRAALKAAFDQKGEL